MIIGVIIIVMILSVSSILFSLTLLDDLQVNSAQMNINFHNRDSKVFSISPCISFGMKWYEKKNNFMESWFNVHDMKYGVNLTDWITWQTGKTL